MSNIINSYRFVTAAGGYDFGNALDFDGTDDYVTIPTTITAQNSWTFSLWFNADSFAATIPIGSHATSNYQFGQILSSTLIRIRVTANAEFTVPTMSTGTWYHLMMTGNGSTAKLYLNGTESSSGSLNPGTLATRCEQLGRNQAASVFWNGKMDELIFETGTVYGLTDAQNLYNSGDGVASDTIITGADWYYKMNESGTTTTANDETSNGFDGTLNNFPASGMWVTH